MYNIFALSVSSVEACAPGVVGYSWAHCRHLGLLGVLGGQVQAHCGHLGLFFFFFNLLRNQTGSAVEEVVLLTAISALLFMVKEVWNP